MAGFFLFSGKNRKFVGTILSIQLVRMARAWLCILIFLFTTRNALCLDLTDKNVLIAGNFSAGKSSDNLPAGWEPLLFNKIKKHTVYSLVEDNGSVVVKAVADATASGLIRNISIDLKEYPIINWKWKVGNILKKGDVRRKNGDDYPARIYVAFEYVPGKLSFFEKSKYEIARLIYGRYPPYAAINYIWESRAPQDSMVPNPYTSRTMMFVIETGDKKLGRWIEEERDVYKDYKKAFGDEPPMVSGVAIMTDTDDTGEKATAFYGDIKFKKKGK